MIEITYEVTDKTVSARAGRVEIVISRDCISGGCAFCSDLSVRGNEISLAELLHVWLGAKEMLCRQQGGVPPDLRATTLQTKRLLGLGLQHLDAYRRGTGPRPHAVEGELFGVKAGDVH